MTSKGITVAQYLKQQIALSDKSQKDIAKEAGFVQANNISMIKDGITKLPIARVPGVAKAIGVDPVHLLRITMREYMPETWTIIEGLLGKSVVSDADLAVLKLMHKSMRNLEPDMNHPTVVESLRSCFEKVAEQQLKDRESAVRTASAKAGSAKKS